MIYLKKTMSDQHKERVKNYYALSEALKHVDVNELISAAAPAFWHPKENFEVPG